LREQNRYKRKSARDATEIDGTRRSWANRGTKVGTQPLNVSFAAGDIKTMATHVANGLMR
jgi:hypothetical protein